MLVSNQLSGGLTPPTEPRCLEGWLAVGLAGPKPNTLNSKPLTKYPQLVACNQARLRTLTFFLKALNPWPRSQDRLRTLNPLAGSAWLG